MDCGNLTAGLGKNCDKPISSGTNGDLLLMTKADFDLAVANGTITFDATTPNLITALVLSTGKQGFLFEGTDDQVKPKIEVVIKNGLTLYKQEIVFNSNMLDAESEKVLDSFQDTKVVAIYKNSFHGIAGETKYKVLGVDSGLILTARALEPLGEFAGWVITLSSKENALEAHGQYSFYHTDEATTDTEYLALQTPAS